MIKLNIINNTDFTILGVSHDNSFETSQGFNDLHNLIENLALKYDYDANTDYDIEFEVTIEKDLSVEILVDLNSIELFCHGYDDILLMQARLISIKKFIDEVDSFIRDTIKQQG